MSLFGPPNVEKMKGKRDVPGLIEALAYQKDATVRKDAAQALGEIGEADGVEPLIAALAERNDDVRMAVVEALIKIDDVRAIKPMVSVIGDSDTKIWFAARVYLMKKRSVSFGPLASALKSDNKTLAQKAARILGELKDARSVEPLVAALGRNDAAVSPEAARALSAIGAPAVEPLVAMLKKPHNRETSLAIEALVGIGQPAVEPLIALLESEETFGRQAVTKALAGIGAPALKPLAATLRNAPEQTRKYAVEALTAIGPAAIELLVAELKNSESSPEVRRAAAAALGKMGEARALGPQLTTIRALALSLENAESGEDRAVFIRALEQLGWSPDSSPAGMIYRVAKRRFEEMAEFGEAAVPFLIGALDGDDSTVREPVIRALGSIGVGAQDGAHSKPIVERLLKALDDESPSIRLSAALSLKRIGEHLADAELSARATELVVAALDRYRAFDGIYPMLRLVSVLNACVQEPKETYKLFEEIVGAASEAFLSAALPIPVVRDFIARCEASDDSFVKTLLPSLIAESVSARRLPGITFADLQSWISQAGKGRSARRLAEAIVFMFSSKVTTADIDRLIADHDPSFVAEVVTVAVTSGVDGITGRDLLRWMEMIEPEGEISNDQYANKSHISAQWSPYQRLALAVVNARVVEQQRGVVRTAITSLSNEEESALISDWIENLQAPLTVSNYGGGGRLHQCFPAEKAMLANDLVVAAFRKKVTGVEFESVTAVTEACLGARDNIYVSGQYKNPQGSPENRYASWSIDFAASIIDEYGDDLDLSDVLRWFGKSEGSPSGNYTNLSKIPVSAIRNKTLRSAISAVQIDSWVSGCIAYAKDLSDRNYAIEYARVPAYLTAAEIAAAAVDEGINGLTDEMAKRWVKDIGGRGGADQAPLHRALIRKHESMKVTGDFVNEWMSNRTVAVAHIGIEAVQQSGLDITTDMVRGWISRFIPGTSEQGEQGVNLIVAALQNERFDFTPHEIEQWGGQLVASPVRAVQVGLAALDAGISVPDASIESWQAACYEGKTPEEIADNAIALIEVYRSRPICQQMPGLQDEIEKAFASVMEKKDALGITDETPMAEAVKKIRELFLGSGKRRRSGADI